MIEMMIERMAGTEGVELSPTSWSRHVCDKSFLGSQCHNVVFGFSPLCVFNHKKMAGTEGMVLSPTSWRI